MTCCLYINAYPGSYCIWGVFVARKMQSSGRTLAGSTVWRMRCSLWDPFKEQEGRGLCEKDWVWLSSAEQTSWIGLQHGKTARRNWAAIRWVPREWATESYFVMWLPEEGFVPSGRMGDTLGLMEDLPSTSYLAASSHLITNYSVTPW